MSGVENQDELVTQFQDVTGTNEERAKFFLEASGWDMHVAVASFYEEANSDHEEEGYDSSSLLSPDIQVPVLTPQPPPQSRAPPHNEGPPKKEPRTGGGLATLDTLRQQEESSSDEDDKAQAFFAGGSVTSGQQVLGPPKKKDEFIKDLFQKAREHGATAEDPSAPPSNRPRPSFSGTGYKLGDASGGGEQERVVPSKKSVESEPKEVTLRLWNSGFSVDNGELRQFSDPNNLEFLNAIKRGEIPTELIRSYPGREVHVTMEDRRHETYEPPRASTNPFSGTGHVLGSPAPTVVTSTAQVAESDRTRNEETARSQINLTDTEPTTNIQFRLADGTRLVARFNHTHRVIDLHNFINAARPQFSSTDYILTLFPNRELGNMEATIKDANILNSALIQKIKS